MKFQQLIQILENDQSQFAEYEDWREYLDYETDVNQENVREFANHFGLKGQSFLSKNFIRFTDDRGNVGWLQYDGDIYELVAQSDEDMVNTVESMYDHDKLSYLNIEENDLYVSGWESTIKDVQENPGTVYHYTTQKGLNNIISAGYLKTGYGTGITNRGASGVFTSVNPETYADGTYGDICLEIDLNALKQAENLPLLDLMPEPEVYEQALNEAFLHALGIEHQGYVSSDMSPETVIVNHAIPFQFVRQIG